ncbi:serine/arginine repetitive matrix protein 1-like [Amphibalanus amphitrite]|uniref:serine/arginine repetitive matrix protein 1-like n=1 Tax=Amphibalanus amphitrite TaxID=1232801 RepID=UPI001C922A36|nr:serine/arginine repetitive matrix protein 1-like [Amphibalanus amphitrite]
MQRAPEIITVRSTRRVDEDALCLSLLQADWSELDAAQSITDKWDRFLAVWDPIMNHYMPLKTIKLKHRPSPWMEDEAVKEAMAAQPSLMGRPCLSYVIVLDRSSPDEFGRESASKRSRSASLEDDACGRSSHTSKKKKHHQRSQSHKHKHSSSKHKKHKRDRDRRDRDRDHSRSLVSPRHSDGERVSSSAPVPPPPPAVSNGAPLPVTPPAPVSRPVEVEDSSDDEARRRRPSIPLSHEDTIDAMDMPHVYQPAALNSFVSSPMYAPLESLPSQQLPAVNLPKDAVYKPSRDYVPVQPQPVKMASTGSSPDEFGRESASKRSRSASPEDDACGRSSHTSKKKKHHQRSQSHKHKHSSSKHKKHKRDRDRRDRDRDHSRSLVSPRHNNGERVSSPAPVPPPPPAVSNGAPLPVTPPAPVSRPVEVEDSSDDEARRRRPSIPLSHEDTIDATARVSII